MGGVGKWGLKRRIGRSEKKPPAILLCTGVSRQAWNAWEVKHGQLLKWDQKEEAQGEVCGAATFMWLSPLWIHHHLPLLPHQLSQSGSQNQTLEFKVRSQIFVSLQTCFPTKTAEENGFHHTFIFQILHEYISLVQSSSHQIPDFKGVCEMCVLSSQPVLSGKYLEGLRNSCCTSNNQIISMKQSPLKSSIWGLRVGIIDHTQRLTILNTLRALKMDKKKVNDPKEKWQWYEEAIHTNGKHKKRKKYAMLRFIRKIKQNWYLFIPSIQGRILKNNDIY